MTTEPIYADFHVHTCFSPCGSREATVRAMVERARAKGLQAVGLADHITPRPIPGCGFYDGQQLETLLEVRAAAEAVRGTAGLELLVGLEADYTLAGEHCLSPEIVDVADHVVCAASHFHLPAAPEPEEPTPKGRAELMVRMARDMLNIPAVTIWAHPFDCSSMRPLGPIMAEIPEETLAELITLANAHEVAIEFNGGPGQLAEYREAMAPFFRLALEMGARFTVTADAHHPNDFERLDLALAWARQLGVPDEAFLTVTEVRERQQRKRAAYLQAKGFNNTQENEP